jgi:hypothetical protein
MQTRIIQTHPQAAEATAWMAAYQAGVEYAENLKVGDVFRGSHGEADHRGMNDDERSMFGSGAYSRIKNMGIWCDHTDDMRIVKIERSA